MLKALKNKIFKKDVSGSKTGNGLFVTFDELMAQREYIKYIKKYNSQRTNSSQTGEVKSAFKGRGVELEEVRAYNFGDDIRDIDWRVTARKQDPYTKIYVEEKDREVYVLLDMSSTMLFGTQRELKSVSAAKIAAMLGWLSLENKDRFGVVIYDGTQTHVFKPQSHQANLIAIFSRISEISENVLRQNGEAKGSLSEAIQLLKKTIKSRAIVFVVSDFKSFETLKKPLTALTKSANLYVVNVFDDLEFRAPKAGEYMIKGSAESLVFDSSSELFQKEYKKYFDAKRSNIRDFCNKFGIHYIEVETARDLYQQIKI